MSTELENTCLKGTFVSHKRSRFTLSPQLSLIKINNVHDRETAKKYINNAVLFRYVREDGTVTENRGMITRIHGSKGVVRAKFQRNLASRALGQEVYIKIYKIDQNLLQ